FCSICLMVDYDLQTPMMQQILDIKKKYPDSILMTRMGDFYELFFDDAKLAARELDITLTSRGGNQRKVPLAGIPYHAADIYIAKLVKKGYKVTICEQVEDPKKAVGLVKREVVRTITPGAVVDSNMLDSGSNNFMLSIFRYGDDFGISLADISTGSFMTTSFLGVGKLLSEISRFSPKECIIPRTALLDKALITDIKNLGIYVNPVNDDDFGLLNSRSVLEKHFDTKYLEGFGIKDMPLSIRSSGALVKYLLDTQLRDMPHLNKIHTYSTDDYMVLDRQTQRNLELNLNIFEGSSKGTLFELFDRANTPMGARAVKRWLLHPLINVSHIRSRHDAVSELTMNIILRKDLVDHFDDVYDIERILSRVVCGSANARDLAALKKSLSEIPYIKKLLLSSRASILKEISSMDSLVDAFNLIDISISDEPPATLRDGGFIKDGYNTELDELRSLSRDGKSWIAKIEDAERKRSGIRSLKIKFNKVFGYYIEVSNSNIGQVPEDYIRKQTLVNGERFITSELKEKESQILGAEEKIKAIEADIFSEVLLGLLEYMDKLKDVAEKIGVLDALCCFSEVASQNNYVRPDITDNDVLKITEGRHPIIEKMLISERFVPNDTILDCSKNMMAVITGPNMAGKSTYMRQVALIVLLAQAGSFVPAASASVGIVDRIFTRVGAHDELSTGQSTFMVEMNETANILNNATSKSLVILDEIGRGTSTYDGLSIAWSVAEYILINIGAKTLFATHYHVMNRLKDNVSGVRNYHVSVREDKDDIIFLRKIEEGGVDKSYGVEVARLAGLPLEVIERARKMQALFEAEDGSGDVVMPVDNDTRKLIDDLGANVDGPSRDGNGRRQKTLFE
ncbi:MAG: DNA mismatch repair protein MutS, partial [Nanohaloarchaea archaeon]|nr:DNA mismatch repair protein MutS [Candidatus Nanohaloarchaea archaeon]